MLTSQVIVLSVIELITKFVGALSLRLPDSYHAMVKEITAKEEISINQFIISAVAEKISALETQNYLEERAERGSRNKFMAVLSKVPDTEPADYDR